MIDYPCRVCKKYVGISSAMTEGTVRVTCRHCGVVQMIFLGNPGGRPLPKELRATSKPC